MSGESGLKLKFQTALAVHLAMTGSLVVYTLLIEIFSGQLKSVLAMDQPSAFLNMRYLFFLLLISIFLFFMYFPRILRWQEWWQSAERKKI